MLNKLRLYFFTIRYLTLTQVQYRIYYFVKDRLRNRVGFFYKKRIASSDAQILRLEESLLASPSVKYKGKTFLFLNLEKTYKNDIDWNDTCHGKLWTYNLNYFEFLHTPNISKEEGVKLIEDFICKIDQVKDGLEPYPISLRVIHWVKFLTYHKIQNKQIERSLYNQLWFLVDKREYHILGNHLLENGFGLLFGAYYFNDAKLYKFAKEILKKELNEQVLGDGAHFELSPMYHQLMLYRVLDCYNLLKNNSLFNQELLSFLKEKAEVMLGWLKQITFENGDIPLLNDSAFGINSTTKELCGYAQQLGIVEKQYSLKESGYRKIQTKYYELVADIGKIGPDYLPGHAHSDTLNFVLYSKGKPFIVDTGTSTYNPTERRHIERSTASHNTVQVGDFEQSEIWSNFRVARRAYPKVIQDTSNVVEAIVNYATVKGIYHHRKFTFEEDKIVITDKVKAREGSTSHLHFHPFVEVSLKGKVIYTKLGTIKIEGAEAIKLIDYQYAPAFNKLISAQKVVIFFREAIITTIEL